MKRPSVVHTWSRRYVGTSSYKQMSNTAPDNLHTANKESASGCFHSKLTLSQNDLHNRQFTFEVDILS